MNADWYFDFVSPYAYLQFSRLPELESRMRLHLRPVLLAAVLDHWGQLGPAEIAPKRRFVYAQARWIARRQDLPLNIPAAHPFNPLPLLRFALHLGTTRAVVSRLFDFVWRDGHIPDSRFPESFAAWRALASSMGVHDVEAAVSDPAAKAALRHNTDEAIAAGVFGVPTLVLGGKAFWGNDATGMVLDYLEDPEPFRRDDARAASLPIAAVRSIQKRD